MKAKAALPEEYREIFAVDLQKDKKMALAVNGAAILIGILMAVPAHFYCSFFSLFDMSQGLGMYAVRFAVLVVGLILYMVLHELTHGIAMKLFGTKKVRFGFTGLYAFAGSDDFYPKKPYLVIALAPVVVFGVLLTVITLLVSAEWFWVAYFIQIANISGAAGDLYVTFKFSRMPADILVQDDGVSMKVYSDQEKMK